MPSLPIRLAARLRFTLPSRTRQGLFLAGNQIGDEGMKALSTALGNGALPNLTAMSLADNQIGNQGMAAFTSALRNGALLALPHLEVRPSQSVHSPLTPPSRHVHAWQGLALDGNNIGDESMAAFATALRKGALPSLQQVVIPHELRHVHPQLVAACQPRCIEFEFHV